MKNIFYLFFGLIFFTACKPKKDSPAPSQSAQCSITKITSSDIKTSPSDTANSFSEFTYDNSGRLTKSISKYKDENFYTVDYYSYDAQNRLSQVKLMFLEGTTESWKSTNRYKYDGSGRLSEVIFDHVSSSHDSTVYEYINNSKVMSTAYVVYGHNYYDTVSFIHIADANGNHIKTLSNRWTKHFDKDSFQMKDEFEYFGQSVPSNYKLINRFPRPFPEKQLEKTYKQYGYNVATMTYNYTFDPDGKIKKMITDRSQFYNGGIETSNFEYSCK